MAHAGQIATLLQGLPKGKLAAERLRLPLTNCPTHVLAAAFTALDSRGATQRALEVFRVLRALPPSDPLSALCNTYTYASIIALTPNSARGVATVEGLLQEMRTRGVRRSVEMYSTALTVCVRADCCTSALQLFEDLTADGLEPDLPAYHTLMDTYGQLRMWEEALLMLGTLMSKGVCEEWCFNLAVTACGRAGRAAEAVDVFDHMLTAGLRPSQATYTALLSLFCRAGAMPEAACVLDGARAAGLQPNTIFYSSLINGCEKAGSLRGALRYFDEMLAAGCKPSVVTFNTLLRACARARAWRLSVHLWRFMLDCGLHPDIVSVRAWITAMHASGCWPGVLLALQQRLPRAVGKDPILQSKLCEALWSAGSTHSRCAALAMPAARVNMSRVDHAVSPADWGASKRPPDPDGPVRVVSTWSTSSQQPGPAAASAALWLHSLISSYDFSMHTMSVTSVWAAAAATQAPHARAHTASGHTGMRASSRLRKPNGAGDGPAFAATRPMFPSGHHGGLQLRGGAVMSVPALLSAAGLGSAYPDAAPPKPHWPGCEDDRRRGVPAASYAYPPPLPFASDLYQYLSPGNLGAQARSALLPTLLSPSPPPPNPAAPPHDAQVLQLELDLSQQEHMVRAISETVDAAIQQYGWPLRMHGQGSTLRLSCNRSELSQWAASGAWVLGVPLPEPLESQRAPHTIAGFLDDWVDGEAALLAALARDGGWPNVPPPPAPEWPAAAAAVASATKAICLPPCAAVRALQILSHLLAPPPGAPPTSPVALSPPVPIPEHVQLAQHSAGQIADLMATLSALHVQDSSPTSNSAAVAPPMPSAWGPYPEVPVHTVNGGHGFGGIAGPPAPYPELQAAGNDEVLSCMAAYAAARSPIGVCGSIGDASSASYWLDAPAEWPPRDGATMESGSSHAKLHFGSGNSRSADSDPGSSASASNTLSSTPPSSEGWSPATMAPAARGRAAPPLSGGHSRGSSRNGSRDGMAPALATAGSSSGPGGGERGGGWMMDSRRAQVMSSLCIAHAATAAEQLRYDVELPREVCRGEDGDSGAGSGAGSPGATISLPASMWQCFDMYLALTDCVPSPMRAALERFRDTHMVALAAAPSLHRLPPSLVAAAALTCSRRLLSVAPEWPQVLVGTTGQELVPQATGEGSAAAAPTALGAACALVAETLRLPPFVPSAYQEALAEGLNGMLRMEKQQAVTKSCAPIQKLQRVLMRACDS